MTINGSIFSSAAVEWSTPRELFAELDAVFDFTLDPCASDGNATCARYFTKADDGLKQSWDGERVFMNPPYGRDIGKWMQKAASAKALVVCLVPARTDTRWWQDYVVDEKAFVHFVRGRLRFGNAKASAPFPSAIVVYFAGVL